MLTLALPTGDLRAPVAEALAAVGLPCEPYAAGSRSLRLTAAGGDVAIRVLREKDIPIQIALGNYDAGICSSAWVEELHARFPQDDVVLLRPLAFGRRMVVVATSPAMLARRGALARWSREGTTRIVSEYPGMADRWARQQRLSHPVIMGVWGAAEAYPPEDADVAIMSVDSSVAVAAAGLVPLATLLDAPAWVIGNRRRLAARDLSPAFGRLLRLAGSRPAPSDDSAIPLDAARAPAATEPEPARAGMVRLAVPDGHAQRHTVVALAKAGLVFAGYEERSFVRRPRAGIPGLVIKVIRPQDMPQQVALGNFDLAITGRDWLLDHRYQFPSSPVEEAVDLGLSRYAIAAAVSEDVPVDTMAEAVRYWRAQGVKAIRIASEYPNIADHFARSRLLGDYRIIPVNGASEAFVPEDSEILIEGTETGSSFRANRLKGIDRVFESTNGVIRHTDRPGGARGALIEEIIDRLRRSVEVPEVAAVSAG